MSEHMVRLKADGSVFVSIVDGDIELQIHGTSVTMRTKGPNGSIAVKEYTIAKEMSLKWGDAIVCKTTDE